MAASIAAHVRALREGDDASKTAAAVALCSLTWSPYIPENRVAIAQAGGIEPLVQLLHDGSAMAKVRAVRALGSLAWNDANKVLIAEAGGVPPLVELLRDGGPHGKQEAAAALRILSRNNANKALITEAGGIPLLVQFLRDGNLGAKPEATCALYNLARNNDANAVAVAVAVGFDALVQLARLARHGRVNFKGCTLVSNAGLPAKRKAALVVAQLIEATAPRTRVSRYIKAAIGSYL